MDFYNLAFYLVSYLAIPLWLMMIFLPHASLTKKLMGSVYIVLPFAVPYAILVLPHLSDVLLWLIPTPEKIEQLLTKPYSDILAWIHFIPMDLFAGRWIYLDSRHQGFSALIMAPILTLCLLLPPLGFVIYMLYRIAFSKAGAPSPNEA